MTTLKEFTDNSDNSITIESTDLFPGQSLVIKASVKTAYGNTITSESLVVVVPQIASGKVYCGPCQLADREMCANLNGVCWDSEKNPTAKVQVSESECVGALATACFDIWKEHGTSDRQCEDFVDIMDFDKMSIRPTVINASYLADGSGILINFSHPMAQAGFTDCSQYFEDDTLNYLPESYPGQWVAPNQLLVEFSIENGILDEISIAADTLFYDYKYAQAAVEKDTHEVREQYKG